MSNPVQPILRALGQLDDPAFLGVVARSLAFSALAFAALGLGAGWALRHLLAGYGDWGWGWVAWLAGGAGALAVAVWLFLPVAVAIAACDLEPVARAVDRRFYPLLPAPDGASLAVQVWDGLVLGGQVLALTLVALPLALLLPGIGLAIGWALTAWGLGRGLFVAVAMRRMSREAARALYRRRRVAVLAQGAVLALAGWVPGLNLLVPVIGTAAMVHVLQGD